MESLIDRRNHGDLFLRQGTRNADDRTVRSDQDSESFGSSISPGGFWGVFLVNVTHAKKNLNFMNLFMKPFQEGGIKICGLVLTLKSLFLEALSSAEVYTSANACKVRKSTDAAAPLLHTRPSTLQYAVKT